MHTYLFRCTKLDSGASRRAIILFPNATADDRNSLDASNYLSIEFAVSKE